MKKTLTDNWLVEIAGGVKVATEPDPRLMTTYILLEQEDWFEEEMSFVRRFIRGHENILDIGANHGVYSLSIASLLTNGHVWAFEPAAATAALLAESIHANAFEARITLLQIGLSDSDRTALLATSVNSETNTLKPVAKHAQGDGEQEEIRLERLDSVFVKGYPKIDFVKLDAEGEEVAILRGSRLFDDQSPLVMFELRHGTDVNTPLVGSLQQKGYHLYFYSSALGGLLPYLESRTDAFRLNLFACRPDREAELRAAGLLVVEDDLGIDRKMAFSISWSEVFAQVQIAGSSSWWKTDTTKTNTPDHLTVFALAVLASSERRPLAERTRLLLAGLALGQRIFEQRSDWQFATTMARLFWLAGLRSEALACVEQALSRLGAQGFSTTLPFLPPEPRQDFMPVRENLANWLITRLLEFKVARSAFSTFFNNDIATLKHLATVREGIIADQRRFLLKAFAIGAKSEVSVPDSLLDVATTPNALNWKLIQTLSRVSLANILGVDSLAIVDVGAASHGQGSEPYAELMQAGLAKVIGFEPDAEEARKLSALYPNNHYLPWFIGADGNAKFHKTNWAMTSGLLKPNEPVLACFTHLQEAVRLESIQDVETRCLDDALSKSGFLDIDMIKIDVQGAELSVFQHAQRALELATVIWTEVEFVALYENQPLFADVDSFLRGNGYQLHTLTGWGTRTFKPVRLRKSLNSGRQLLWADAIYVKDFTKLDSLSPEKLARLAVLLHHVVKSPDFCRKVLHELDNRTKSEYVGRYDKGFLPAEFAISPDLQ